MIGSSISFGLNMWAGIHGRGASGNAEARLNETAVASARQCAQPHYARAVRDHLNESLSATENREADDELEIEAFVHLNPVYAGIVPLVIALRKTIKE
ncbi:unnamed protein product [Pieris macdunnoughi]|uniref:Uncharacterized protein n=1 Tax=Pieris macdunnoughi TaxID=345717 RepID=A0A821SUD0_9NEOP|nr:unnamed protein product [Pieris macdunnoughi]